jgi:demethoxyubiquinone hydroxylase (CLK1/Coq7/Cat5 family)
MTTGAVALLRKRWALLKACVEAMEHSAADHINDRVGRLEREMEHLKDELRRTRMSAGAADCGCPEQR